jgi:hypothetical protein
MEEALVRVEPDGADRVVAVLHEHGVGEAEERVHRILRRAAVPLREIERMLRAQEPAELREVQCGALPLHAEQRFDRRRGVDALNHVVKIAGGGFVRAAGLAFAQAAHQECPLVAKLRADHSLRQCQALGRIVERAELRFAKRDALRWRGRERPDELAMCRDVAHGHIVLDERLQRLCAELNVSAHHDLPHRVDRDAVDHHVVLLHDEVLALLAHLGERFVEVEHRAVVRGRDYGFEFGVRRVAGRLPHFKERFLRHADRGERATEAAVAQFAWERFRRRVQHFQFATAADRAVRLFA